MHEQVGMTLYHSLWELVGQERKCVCSGADLTSTWSMLSSVGILYYRARVERPERLSKEKKRID